MASTLRKRGKKPSPQVSKSQEPEPAAKNIDRKTLPNSTQKAGKPKSPPTREWEDEDYAKAVVAIGTCILASLLLIPVFCHLLLSSSYFQSNIIFLNNIINYPSSGTLQALGSQLDGVTNLDVGGLQGYRFTPTSSDSPNFLPPKTTISRILEIFFPAEFEIPPVSVSVSVPPPATPSNNKKCAIILLHGNASNRGLYWRIKHARQLSSLTLTPCGNNIDVFSFDTRCFGDSFCPTNNYLLNEEDTRKDALTILNHVLEQDEYSSNIYLYGHSLGTSIAANLLMDSTCGNNDHRLKDNCPIRGLILDSPFTSMAAAVKNHPLSFFLRHLVPKGYWEEKVWAGATFKTQSVLSTFLTTIRNRLRFPILILHGKYDKEIPLKTGGVQLFAALSDGVRRKIGWSGVASVGLALEVFEKGHEFVHRDERWGEVIESWDKLL